MIAYRIALALDAPAPCGCGSNMIRREGDGRGEETLQNVAGTATASKKNQIFFAKKPKIANVKRKNVNMSQLFASTIAHDRHAPVQRRER